MCARDLPSRVSWREIYFVVYQQCYDSLGVTDVLQPLRKNTVLPAEKTFVDLRLHDLCLLVNRNPFSHRTGHS